MPHVVRRGSAFFKYTIKLALADKSEGGPQGFQKYFLIQKCHFVSVWAGVERLGTSMIDNGGGLGGSRGRCFLLFSILALVERV